ncbi:ubiquitin-protein ligase e3a-like [Plakobranchus ocellatus]|uniref:HECT-type E3 ubiquitin transferase n=1 Tax=Plakobranchus ocellatus TaxID=259542 RepID=A0AAV4B5X2_9GAST|nr:ubiquitin-protein ligase e3a-like [Plakobranchus ocellatus]
MSSPNSSGSLDGHQSASELTVTSEIEICGTEARESSKSPEMSKRVAAKERILQYYSQLTEGCGNESCTNENCASSSSFRFKDIDRNKLAVEAITLSKAKAELCERRPSKVSRLPQDEGEQESGPSGSPGLAPSTSSSSSSTSLKSSPSSIAVSVPATGGTIGQGAKAKVPSPTSSCKLDITSNSSSKDKEPEYLTEERLNMVIDECEAKGSWSKLIHLIGLVFNNPESILLSFHVKKNLTSDCDTDIDLAQKASSDVPMDCTEPGSKDRQKLSSTGRTSSCVSGPVVDNECGSSTSVIRSTNVDHGDIVYPLDLASLRRAYNRLSEIPDQPFQGALIHALLTLAPTVERDIQYRALERDPNYILIFVIILEIPMLHWPEYLESAFPSICRAVERLPVPFQAKLARIWAGFGAERLKDMVQSLQQLITVKIINNEGNWSASFRPGDIPAIVGATKVLKILYYASMLGGKMDSIELVEEEKRLSEADSLHEHMQGAFGFEIKDSTLPKEDPLGQELGIQVINCQEPLVPWEDFVNEPLNDNLDIGDDYTNYRHEMESKFSLESKFSFVPYFFILTTASKHTSMYYDNRIRMLHERRAAFVQTLLHGGPPNPFLRVRVRRDHIVDDALVNLEMIAMEYPGDFRKQLFVEFEGEQGLDEGGVSKEFFQLIVEELFNPDIGMFTYNEQSHHCWFNSLSFENDAQFTLIGILLGLAIYNSCILDIHFPMVVYRKLMGKKGVFKDLHDVDPTLKKSLQEMLDYDSEDFQDVFEQTFRIGYKDVFGNNLTYDLKEGGDNINVTQENKTEFVNLYADYLLNKSIEQQFRAFKRGFLMVTSESPLRQLFRPEEIEMLVCGSKVFDFRALEKATTYDGGFTEGSQAIRLETV